MEREVETHSSESMADINVTPFIDVLLVLLIIFMVVTPVSMSGLDMALPSQDSSPTPTQQETPLVLEITDDGLLLNQTHLTGTHDFENRIRDLMSARNDKTLFVSVAAINAVYGQVVTVLDTAIGAGTKRIGFLTGTDRTRRRITR